MSGRRAPFRYVLGDCCDSAPIRTDPATGEDRCSGCGYRPAAHGALEPPVVLGGQGRDADETISDAWGIVGTVVLAAFVAAVFAVGIWAAGGGR